MARRGATHDRHGENTENSTPPPESEEDRRFRVAHDAKENQESAIPSNEKVRLVSFTCVEMYTPSTVDGLLESVKRLGWVHDDPHNPPFVNLLDWIRATRSNPYGGAWANLSYIIDVEHGPMPGRPLRASLPPEVQELWARLISVTPSLTCLVVQFVLTEEESLSLDRVIRPSRETVARRMEHGWAYLGPTQQKADLVVAERDRIRRLCESWIARHVPGTFAAGLSIHGMPTVETFVCDIAKPFEDERTPGHIDYRWVLNIDNKTHAYESVSLPGWRLAAWDSRMRSDPFVLRLGARWGDVVEGLEPYGGTDTGALANRLTEPLFPFATRFAIHCLLGGYEQHLAVIRDRVASSSVRKGSVKEGHVREVHDLITETGYDARVVAWEIADLCRDEQRYAYVADFTPVAEWRREHGKGSLIENLRTSDLTRSTGVMATEATVHNMAATAAQLLASRINLRLGRRVVILTWVLLGIAALTLLTTVLAIVQQSG
ncbi:MAG: hypothetical protein ACR2NT_05680 [Acidimicrobiia bacterium]